MGDIKYLSPIDFGAQRAKNAADPTSATDLATKQYVDNVAAGLNWKQNVRAASTANVTIASALTNGSSMDGVTLATGDRVLLKNQTTGSENGIYIVVSSGAASRATDADTSAEVQNMIVRVAEGTTLGDTMWQMVTDSITLGTTSLTFTQFSAGVTYTAGNGLQLSAGAFSVVADTGIAVSGSGVAIDTAVVVRKYTTAVGNGSATDITVTHNLGTKDVHVQVRDSTTWQEVFVDNDAPTTNTVALHFSAAPASNAYRAIVHA
jgi:hypothetical protein